MSKVRGVNLGNWLVLEKWMKPTLFDDVKGGSETDLMIELGDKAPEFLTAHRDKWITFEDFKWLSEHGINTVRIPITHWIFGDFAPNLGCIEYLDNAMEWAKQTGIKVLIDMHGAPGSQNGDMHSGICGRVDWPKDDANIVRTIDILQKLANRYKDHPALHGVQMLNEPNHHVPNDILRDYYIRCYHALRKEIDEDKPIVFHDQFNITSWRDFMQSPEYKNVALDCHIYQCFSPTENKFSMREHINWQLDNWNAALKDMQKYFKIYIGEWSLSANAQGANDFTRDAFYRAFAAAQIINYEDFDGWFFWSYKVESDYHQPQWSYRDCVEKNYFASNPDGNKLV